MTMYFLEVEHTLFFLLSTFLLWQQHLCKRIIHQREKVFYFFLYLLEKKRNISRQQQHRIIWLEGAEKHINLINMMHSRMGYWKIQFLNQGLHVWYPPGRWLRILLFTDITSWWWSSSSFLPTGPFFTLSQSLSVYMKRRLSETSIEAPSAASASSHHIFEGVAVAIGHRRGVVDALFTELLQIGGHKV